MRLQQSFIIDSSLIGYLLISYTDETLTELIKEAATTTKNDDLMIQFTAFLILMEKVTRIEKVIDRDSMMKAIRL